MPALLFGLTLISCSSDYQNTPEGNTGSKSSAGIEINPTCCFECDAQVFGTVYERLIGSTDTIGQQALLDTCLERADFIPLYAEGYADIKTAELMVVITQGQGDFSTLQPLLELSDPAFGRLLQLVQGMSALKAALADQRKVTDYILSSESLILRDSGIPACEKKMLLTTSAIIRQRLDVEKRKKRKDRDWELSIGHIAATSYGAKYGRANAITSALASLLAVKK